MLSCSSSAMLPAVRREVNPQHTDKTARMPPAPSSVACPQVRRFSPNLLQLLVYVPRLARCRCQAVTILGQQKPVGDQSIHGLGQSSRPDITRCVTGFEGGPRIVGPQPLGF